MEVKRRGRLTYYYHQDNPLFSSLVTEALDPETLKVYFAGVTGGHTAARVLRLKEFAFMNPDKEIPLVFETWSALLREARLCDSVADIDFIEMHVFGRQPKSPSPITDPAGYVKERERLREAYARAYGRYFRDQMPDRGLPVRFTVNVTDVPDEAASYEFAATGLLQREPV